MTDAGIGQRVAAHRRRRGLSQAALAGLVGRSESWLSQVERGRRQVDRLSVLLDMARILRVDVEALTGTPSHDGPNAAVPMDELEAVRRVLVGYPALTATRGHRAMSAGVLAERAEALHHDYQAANYAELIAALPELLVGADQTWQPSMSGRESLLAHVSVYVATAKLLTKLGATDLATTAADRAATAATASDSLVAQGLAVYQVVCALLGGRRTDDAESLAVAMAERCTTAARTTRPSLLSVAGALWLIAALTAARRADGRQADRCLGHADRLAGLLGTDANHAWTAFGPTNVAIHRVSVAAELGDPAAAVAAAAAVDVNRMPAGLLGRRAQVHLDLAWAQAKRKRDAEATLHLVEAERLAPESIRYNILARETMWEMLSRQRTRPNRMVNDLAARAGVLG